jgi:hypothetical protein
MNKTHSISTVQITVDEAILSALVALKQSPEEPLASVIDRASNALRQRNEQLVYQEERETKATIPYCKHEVVFLGSIATANSYGELYGKLVDMLFAVAPEAVKELAEMKARSRHYVAKDHDKIHPGSMHLPTLKTKTGWFVSKNIGKIDFFRGVKALCKSANIKFGEDVMFRR